MKTVEEWERRAEYEITLKKLIQEIRVDAWNSAIKNAAWMVNTNFADYDSFRDGRPIATAILALKINE